MKEKTRLASLSNFLLLFYNCLWTKNIFIFKFLPCKKRMSDVYNIKLDLRRVSEADIRRNLKWLLSIGFMTFLLSYKYSMYPENAVFFSRILQTSRNSIIAKRSKMSAIHITNVNTVNILENSKTIQFLQLL